MGEIGGVRVPKGGDLDIPERTLRRAAGEGLIRGERVSAHKFRTSVRERDYLRRQWPMLAQLRGLLRTEPNVSFAALYGSQAAGTAGPDSDVDLVVGLRRDELARLADLSGRLSRARDAGRLEREAGEGISLEEAVEALDLDPARPRAQR